MASILDHHSQNNHESTKLWMMSSIYGSIPCGILLMITIHQIIFTRDHSMFMFALEAKNRIAIYMGVQTLLLLVALGWSIVNFTKAPMIKPI